MTVERFVAVSGIVLSLLFEYIPGLATWYNSLKDNYQKLFMLVLMGLVAGGAYGLSCYGRVEAFTCDEAGIWKALELLLLAIIPNQVTHRLLPKRG